MDKHDNTLSELQNSLVLLLSFEKYWLLNYISKGTLFKEESEKEAFKLIELLKSLRSQEVFNNDSPLTTLLETLERDCVKTETAEVMYITNVEQTYCNIRTSIIMAVKEICQILNISTTPIVVNPMVDGLSSLRLSEWLGQVHPAVISQLDSSFASCMSESDTITIVADIRRSQDLMTYSSAETYSSKIIEFIGAVKDIIVTNFGVFDKFTGDGFIAYFNKYMCENLGSGTNYYNQMWMACVRIIEYSNMFFSEWSKTLRKIPEEQIGLSIGVDTGRILFTILDHQVFAVGEPCVWATRMCCAGHSGEVVFNNIPYNHILECHLGLNFHEVESSTKTGEKFKSHKVII